MGWSEEQLRHFEAAEELEIATRRADGTLRRWLPIWVVRAGERVYVRTWYRRDTGWFGHVIDLPQARIRVPGLETDVVVRDVGADEARAEVDAAYVAKYGERGAERMVADEAAATTLRLDPGTAG